MNKTFVNGFLTNKNYFLTYLLTYIHPLSLGPSKWVCLEVVNINNDRGVFSIPRLRLGH